MYRLAEWRSGIRDRCVQNCHRLREEVQYSKRLLRFYCRNGMWDYYSDQKAVYLEYVRLHKIAQEKLEKLVLR